MRLYELLAGLDPATRSHALTAFKIADDGSNNALAVLKNIDDSVRKIRAVHPNPNSARNYVAALRTITNLPPVRQILGEKDIDSINARLDEHISQVNQRAYAFRKQNSIKQQQTAAAVAPQRSETGALREEIASLKKEVARLSALVASSLKR
jgi:hypothetical protein